MMNADSNLPDSRARRASERRRRLVDSNRGDILTAAEKVFSQRGFAGASMEEIAASAGFAVGSLYNFFESKKALYGAVITSNTDMLDREVAACFTPSGSALSVLYRLHETRVGLFWRYPLFFRLFFQQTEAPIEDLRGGFRREVRRLYTLVRDRVRTLVVPAIERGEFMVRDPGTVALAFDLLTRSYLAELSRRDSPRRDPEEEFELFRIIARGVASPEAYSCWLEELRPHLKN